MKINHRLLWCAEPAIGMLPMCILKTNQLLDAYMESPVKDVPRIQLPLIPKIFLSPNCLEPGRQMVMWTEYSSLGGSGL